MMPPRCILEWERHYTIISGRGLRMFSISSPPGWSVDPMPFPGRPTQTHFIIAAFNSETSGDRHHRSYFCPAVSSPSSDASAWTFLAKCLTPDVYEYGSISELERWIMVSFQKNIIFHTVYTVINYVSLKHTYTKANNWLNILPEIKLKTTYLIV